MKSYWTFSVIAAVVLFCTTVLAYIPPLDSPFDASLQLFYTYRDNGQVATITDANGVVATHAYNGAGDLTGITYSDGTTDPITVAFNRRGLVEASGQSGVSNAFVYTLDGQITTNTVTGSGTVPNAQLTYAYGSTHPGLTSAGFTVDGETRSVTVGRNARKLVSSLADGNVTAEYTYESGAPFVNAVTVKVDSVAVMTRAIGWDAVNDRITNITCTVDGSNVASFAYTWQTNADRIASVTLADGSYWTYTYDSRGHLASGERYFADGTPYFGLQYGAEFDSIGNTLEGGPLSGGVPEHSFTPNDLNVHVSRAWSNKVELLGRAATNATVTVNDEPTDRVGEWFRAIITVDNLAEAVETNVVITAVWFDAVASNDVVATSTGSVLVAEAGETPTYDNRAAMTEASRYEYDFDAFGRLIEVITTASSPQVREQYTYYADGRRATKTVATGAPGSWTDQATHTFTYDAWNLIHETVTNHVESTALVRQYVWGLDLVGQRDGEIGQQAGGIGGLLAIREIESGVTNVYLPIADHIGNVMHLVDADSGEVVANYLYSPYGVLAGEWGEAKDACPFRFQSKYMDAEAGLYYFGYRFYDPASVKFLTRDILGERAGVNLTAGFRGDPVNQWEYLGLATLDEVLENGVIDNFGELLSLEMSQPEWEEVLRFFDRHVATPDWYESVWMKEMHTSWRSLRRRYKGRSDEEILDTLVDRRNRAQARLALWQVMGHPKAKKQFRAAWAMAELTAIAGEIPFMMTFAHDAGRMAQRFVLRSTPGAYSRTHGMRTYSSRASSVQQKQYPVYAEMADIDARAGINYASGGARVTTTVPEGDFIWAQLPDGSFRFASRSMSATRATDPFPHPMLSGGKPVIAAGEGVGRGGRAIYLNPKTGHFRVAEGTVLKAAGAMATRGLLADEVVIDVSLTRALLDAISCVGSASP